MRQSQGTSAVEHGQARPSQPTSNSAAAFARFPGLPQYCILVRTPLRHDRTFPHPGTLFLAFRAGIVRVKRFPFFERPLEECRPFRHSLTTFAFNPSSQRTGAPCSSTCNLIVARQNDGVNCQRVNPRLDVVLTFWHYNPRYALFGRSSAWAVVLLASSYS